MNAAYSTTHQLFLFNFKILHNTYIKSQLYLHFLFVYKNSSDKFLFRKNNNIIYETNFFRSITMHVKLSLSDHQNIANYHNILIMLKRII